ncbi:MAG: DNA mismatch repair protein MutS, partial [Eubacteriales bacterium]|nr:DNA mismatch repair protein MutS [Eubacteriales bacterium]
MALSHMMQQYMEIKEKHKDCILFFRLGDFYEMFFDDAIIAVKELKLTLTGKSCGLEQRAPMCGVPFHSADTYIAALVAKRYKVAICEQVEDPAQAKGIVKREVVQIITPGTVLNGPGLDEKENNYLACVFASDKSIALSYCDISTGELYSVDFTFKRGKEILFNELAKINPKEILFQKSLLDIISEEEIKETTNAYINILGDMYFSNEAGRKAILKQFD